MRIESTWSWEDWFIYDLEHDFGQFSNTVIHRGLRSYPKPDTGMNGLSVILR